MLLLLPEEQRIRMPMRMGRSLECRIRRLQCHSLWRQLILVNFYTGVGSCRTLQMKALTEMVVCSTVLQETVMVLRKLGRSLYLEKSSTRKLPSRRTIPWPSDTVPSGYALMQGQTLTNLHTRNLQRLIRQALFLIAWLDD